MSTPEIDAHLLATLTADERAAYEESLNDPEMQNAIEEVESMTDDEMRAALAGKDDDKPAEDAQSEAPEAEADSILQPTEEPFRPVLRANLPENIDQIEANIAKAREDIERKFREGEIDFDEYKNQDKQHAAAQEEVRVRKIQALTYADMETQRVQQEWQWNVSRFIREAKASDGVDYAGSQKLYKDLDLMVKALAVDPDNNSLTQEQYLQEAHKRVLALHGLSPKGSGKQDARAVANKDRRPPMESIPRTVGDLPGGGDDSDVGVGGEFAAIDKLSGAAYERALAKMPDDQRRRYLESA
jgi:hypothetical protein